MYQDVSPGASDATLLFRATVLTSVAWFDAIAPYHPTAIGIYTQHTHRLTETTNKNKNIAVLYASYQIFMNLYPKRKADWDAMLTDVGLDPTLNSNDVNTPEGLGIIAGKNVIANRENDGMNQLGNKLTKNTDKKYHRSPYSDYTGYIPKNTAYELFDPSSWQPAVVTTGNGLFKVQQFVTPQIALTTPFSYKNPEVYKVQKPRKSDVKNWADYVAQAQILVDASANLDEQKKLKSQFFDNKFRSLGRSANFIRQIKGVPLDQFIHIQLLTQLASFDTAIAVWQEKARFDAVRPFSAIGHIWGNSNISAWGGPGKGLVNDLPADQWKSYLRISDHPEYPSGSASFCAAHTTVLRKYFNDDTLGYTIPYPKGQSSIEPGVTPAADTFITFATWTDFNNDCGSSRMWGGVHFPAAVEAGKSIGTQIGNCAYQFIKAHVDGILLPNDSNCKN